MRYENTTSLAVAHVVTSWPAPRATMLAKGRYRLRDGGPATLHEEPARLSGDVPYDGLPQRLRYPNDLVPEKPRADILLVGCSPAPNQTPSLRIGTHRFVSPKGAVEPFAPLAHDAPSRFAKLGTYDERWLNERWPWFPEDFDAGYFNAAPPALQIEPLVGDEDLELRQLSRGLDKLVSALPGLRPRCFLDEQRGSETRLREVVLQLDTVFIDALAETLELVWRGVTGVQDEEGSPIVRILWAEERLADEPEPLAAYERKARLVSLPPATPPAAPPLANDNDPEPADVSERERAALDELHDKLESLGAPSEMLALVAKAERLADAMRSLEESVHQDPAQAKAAIADAEEKLRARLRAAGHPIAEPPPTQARAVHPPTPWSRERVELAAREGVSMAEADLSGLDLSELDLHGANLAGALLTGAKLDRARLYNADLREASLVGASLAGAALGLAKLDAANLTSVSGAGANFKNATLTHAIFDEARLAGATFDEADGEGASFRRADLTKAIFRAAKLDTARFVTAILHDASFEGASLENATLRAARGEHVSFAGTRLEKLRANDAELAHADLSGARGDGSMWMDADLRQATLAGASLRRADLSRTRLERADLSGSNCENADFTRADLTRAALVGGNFAGARFTGAALDRANARNANFFEAELWRATRRGLELEGAHVAMSKLASETHV